MAKGRMDFSAFVGKLLEEQDGDVLREGIRVLAQALMETEVAGLIGAERYERSGERAGYRNGYRLWTWDTRVGTIELSIPKVKPGSYFPSLLEPRRRAERALLGVIQEAKRTSTGCPRGRSMRVERRCGGRRGSISDWAVRHDLLHAFRRFA
jgi:transposase-like protein